MPDLTNIYKALPASSHALKQQMEATLLKYEPRIRAIDVAIIGSDDLGLLASFETMCHLKKTGLVRFGTYFVPPASSDSNDACAKVAKPFAFCFFHALRKKCAVP